MLQRSRTGLFVTWRYDRRALLLGVGAVLCLPVLLFVAALVLRLSGGGPSHHTAPQPPASAAASKVPPPAASPTAPADDVASWNAIPPVTPAVSANYPAVAASARRDPDAYARAFATELFTRDYRHSTLAQLIGWVQYEDSPLQSPNYPRADWTKVLVDSLTDLTWDQALETPIPAQGEWLALRSEQAWQTVTDLKVVTDPVWEQQIAGGYQPPDALATVRDVSFTVVQRTTVSGHVRVARFAVSLALQLGTSTHGGGYGTAVTNNYVIKEIG